jgi:hypothetical protein
MISNIVSLVGSIHHHPQKRTIRVKARRPGSRKDAVYVCIHQQMGSGWARLGTQSGCSQFGTALGDLAQLHGKRHVARDLQLALHERLLRVQLALHQRRKVRVRQLQTAVRLGSVLCVCVKRTM